MKLYHSSTVSVNLPDILHSRDYLDFGKGFYLTSIHEQAVRYAQQGLKWEQFSPVYRKLQFLADNLGVRV